MPRILGLDGHEKGRNNYGLGNRGCGFNGEKMFFCVFLFYGAGHMGPAICPESYLVSGKERKADNLAFLVL